MTWNENHEKHGRLYSTVSLSLNITSAPWKGLMVDALLYRELSSVRIILLKTPPALKCHIWYWSRYQLYSGDVIRYFAWAHRQSWEWKSLLDLIPQTRRARVNFIVEYYIPEWRISLVLTYSLFIEPVVYPSLSTYLLNSLSRTEYMYVSPVTEF